MSYRTTARGDLLQFVDDGLLQATSPEGPSDEQLAEGTGTYRPFLTAVASSPISVNSVGFDNRGVLVDDRPEMIELLEAYMEEIPQVQTVTASDGAEALEQVSKHNPDVVLLDIVMPDMDGAAATKQLRDDYPEGQIIALTSFQEKELIRDALFGAGPVPTMGGWSLLALLVVLALISGLVLYRRRTI